MWFKKNYKNISMNLLVNLLEKYNYYVADLGVFEH